MRLYDPSRKDYPTKMKTVKTTVVDKPGGKEVVQEVVDDKSVIEMLIDIEEKEFNKDKFEIEDYTKNLNFPLDVDENANTLTQANTLIRSDINTQMESLFVTSGRICLNRTAANELLDIEITELDIAQTSEPVGAPVIDQFEIRNVVRVESEGKQDKDTQQGYDLHVLDKDAANFDYTIGANHHLLIVANANNWVDEASGEVNREGLTYTWRFTSGETNYDRTAIDQIVSVGRQLSIENVQRDAIGTYYLEVSNKFGKQNAFPVKINVDKPGEVREETMKLGENEILTGKYVWLDNDQTDQYNENVTVHDAKELYDYSVEADNEVYDEWPNRWVEVYYQKGRWYRDDNNLEFEGNAPNSEQRQANA